MEKGDGDGVTGPEVLRKEVNPKCRSEGRPLERERSCSTGGQLVGVAAGARVQ